MDRAPAKPINKVNTGIIFVETQHNIKMFNVLAMVVTGFAGALPILRTETRN